MKTLLLFLLLSPFFSQAQLISGDVVKEKRKLISQNDFVINGGKTGDVFFELTINREGIVTASRLITEKTTVVSTPTRMRAKDYVSTFEFEKGTHYPQFQNVVVCVKVKAQLP